MQNINEWMRKILRNDAENLSSMPLHWLEIMRDTWTPLVMRAVSFILNDGTFLICTDSEREWFKYYVLNKINSIQNNRPYIPIYSFDNSLIRLLDSNNEVSSGMIQDVLGMSYKRYAFWYIGLSNNKLAQFAIDSEDSLLWTLDDTYENSFTLNANDSNLDFKLIQSYRIFETAIFAGIFGEFNINMIEN